MSTIPFSPPAGPSPVESRALAHVAKLEHLAPIMAAQHAKGREEHGQEIDAWSASPLTILTEAAAEGCDWLTYLERFRKVRDVPPELLAHIREACRYMDMMIRAEAGQ